MRSLAVKLTLAFLLVGLIGAGIVAIHRQFRASLRGAASLESRLHNHRRHSARAGAGWLAEV